MSLSEQQAIEAALTEARSYGIDIQCIDDFVTDGVIIKARLGNVFKALTVSRIDVEDGRIGYDVSRLIAEVREAYFNDGIITTGTLKGEADLFRRKYKEANQELERYKAAVKKLAFDLEMAKSGSPAIIKHDEVRKVALEQAAEFLMDHGIVTTGPELEKVCQQIRKLQVSEARV